MSKLDTHFLKFRKFILDSGSDMESLKFSFWPSYPTPTGLPGSSTEPDVQIYGPDILIFIETKLHSGFGELQIARELAVGLEESVDREFFLVIVTPGISPPRIRYQGVRLEIGDYLHALSSKADISTRLLNRLSENSDRILWISWHSIISTLNSAHQQHRNMIGNDSAEIRRAWDIIGDLNQLLLMRGIQPFGGFSHVVYQSPAATTAKPLLKGIPAPPIHAKMLRLDRLQGFGELKPLPEKGLIFPHTAPMRNRGMRFSLTTMSGLTQVAPIPGGYFTKFPSKDLSIRNASL